MWPGEGNAEQVGEGERRVVRGENEEEIGLVSPGLLEFEFADIKVDR